MILLNFRVDEKMNSKFKLVFLLYTTYREQPSKISVFGAGKVNSSFKILGKDIDYVVYNYKQSPYITLHFSGITDVMRQILHKNIQKRKTSNKGSSTLLASIN